jgi:hypothetical protein
MSNKLKQITTKAKQLYKSGKFAKWTDAIKAASKTVTKTVKKASKKIGDYNVNESNFVETRLALTPRKKKAKKVKKYSVTRNVDGTYKKGGVKRISGVKTKAAPKKKAAVKSYHTDKNSHNVKLTIMSGLGTYNSPENILMEIEYWQKMLDKLRNEYKSEKGKQYKHSITLDIRMAKKWLELNKQKLKKVITKIK